MQQVLRDNLTFHGKTSLITNLATFLRLCHDLLFNDGGDQNGHGFPRLDFRAEEVHNDKCTHRVGAEDGFVGAQHRPVDPEPRPVDPEHPFVDVDRKPLDQEHRPICVEYPAVRPESALTWFQHCPDRVESRPVHIATGQSRPLRILWDNISSLDKVHGCD